MGFTIVERQKDIFEQHAERLIQNNAPLAERMRPRSFEELYGQDAIVNGPLRSLYETGHPFSVILYGPAGSGKTTIARLLAERIGGRFEPRSAIDLTATQIRNLAVESKQQLGLTGQPTLLFIDEIHRLNRAQQDVLLPWLEDGTLYIVGATTENPLYVLQPALLSRVTIHPVQPLEPDDLEIIARLALADHERGLGRYQVKMEEDALKELVRRSRGDARRLLNGLEVTVLSTPPDNNDGVRHVTLDILRKILKHSGLSYDQAGDQHYDTISAFIKSIRGSDPDAAVHYLARMLHGGEDPMYIARRLVIAAAEDIGLADPSALPIAVAAMTAVEKIGMPEARIPLAEATIYLAIAKKSNTAYKAISRALADIEQGRIGDIPSHLRDKHRARIEWSENDPKPYLYPHDYPGHWVEQQYMPDELLGVQYVDRHEETGDTKENDQD